MTAKELLLQAREMGIRLYLKDGKLFVQSLKGTITDSLKNKISEKKPELIELLTKGEKFEVFTKIKPSGHNKAHLSFSQRRLLSIDKINGGSAEYNMASAYRIRGAFQVDIAEKAITKIIERHKVLRTVFKVLDEEYFQIVIKDFIFSIIKYDVRNLTRGNQNKKINLMIKKDRKKIFDLTRELMIRVSYIFVSDNEGVLLLNVHHIASDRWSMDILLNEFVSEYNRLKYNKKKSMDFLFMQYIDFSIWEKNNLKNDLFRQQSEYWLKQLQGAPIIHGLPINFTRDKNKSHISNNISHAIGKESVRKLKKLAKERKVTLFMLFHAIIGIVISKHSNSTDVVIGTSVANRPHVEFEHLIGFFVNNLPLRTSTEFETFFDYLSDVKHVNLNAHANQSVPFECILENCNIARNTQYIPFMEIQLNIHNNSTKIINIPGVEFYPITYENISAKFELSIDIYLDDDEITISWLYDTSIFSRENIYVLNEHTLSLLDNIIENPHLSMHEVSILSDKEKRKILNLAEGEYIKLSKTKLVHDLFEDQCKKNPDKLAIICQGKEIAYEEVNRRSNRLAHFLREIGVAPNKLVGIYAERSFEMVLAILAIFKAGGAYVPLDPDYPNSKIKYLIENAQLDIILLQEHLIDKIEFNSSITSIILDSKEFSKKIFNFPSNNLVKDKTQHPKNLAYVMHTSGSTGHPKGVMIEHLSLINRIDWMQRQYNLNHNDRILQKTPYSFDVSVWEFLWPLCYGAKLVIAKPGGQADPQYIKDTLAQEKITVVHFVPSMLNAYLQYPPPIFPDSVRYIFCSGEALKVLDANYIHENANHVELHNLYGPTETTIDVTSYKHIDNRLPYIPIGKPIQNTKIFILDKNLKICPIYCVGELFIGGLGLAKGYLNNPELTAMHFIKNPHDTKLKENLYKTGDLARYLPDGNIEYVGRIGEQVKIRGARIEIGEIEYHLGKDKDLREFAVLAKRGESDEQILVAYIVPKSKVDNDLLLKKIKNRLEFKLPKYAIPSAFIVIDSLPKTANGKLDKNSLPNVEKSEFFCIYTAPNNDIERELVEIWSNLLKINSEEISTMANFFDLGGHSLLATRMIIKISKSLKVKLSVKDIFDHQTISEISELINSKNIAEHRVIQKAPKGECMPLSYSQQRLWLINSIDKNNTQYNMPYLIKLVGKLNNKALKYSIYSLIEKHQILRTTYHADEKGNGNQIVEDMNSFRINNFNVNLIREEDRGDEIKKIIHNLCFTPFDLENEYSIKINKLKINNNENILIFVFHHIAVDDWSIGLLINEFSNLYNHFCKHKKENSEKLSLQYFDYAYWEKNHLSKNKIKEKLEYWENKLSGIPAVHSLPLDNPRPPYVQHKGKIVHRKIDFSTKSKLEKVLKKENVTLFMLLNALFSILLSKHSGETDIVFGSPVANRTDENTEEMIGCFVNTIVLRNYIDDAVTITDFIKESKKVLLQAYKYQDVPFEMVIEKIQPHRSFSYAPLIQIMLNFNKYEPELVSLDKLNIEQLPTEEFTAKFELTLSVVENINSIDVNWEYSSEIFNKDSIINLAKNLETLLHMTIADTSIKIRDISFFENEIISKQHEISCDIQNSNLYSLIEHHALTSPDSIAIQDQSQYITYKELIDKVNSLSFDLSYKGIERGSVVGICMERSPLMIITMLAIIKNAACYVALDPNYPEKRIKYILSDSNAKLFIISKSVAAKFSFDNDKYMLVDKDYMFSKNFSASKKINASQTDIVYIIYTSGSTGDPKGVKISNINVVSMLMWAINYYNTHELKLVLASSSITFDLSAFEIFLPLVAGKTILLVENIFSLAKENDLKPTLINTVPSGINMLIELNKVPDSAIVINLAGEALSANIVNQLIQDKTDRKILNLYGPSETTTYSTYSEFNSKLNVIPDIGKPLSNTECFVCDKNGKLCPPGVVGELYIGGLGVSPGYVNHKNLTKNKFIKNHINFSKKSPVLYKTGDLVRVNNNGDLEYIGRIDHQVKIRGHRIELREIEHNLLCHNEINKCYVSAIENNSREKILVAYVLLKDHSKNNESTLIALKKYLADRIPDYMIPGFFKIMEEFPLTPNGKIDISSLPKYKDMITTKKFNAPNTKIEIQLAEIWSRLLKIDIKSISREDDFFDSGAHSLTVMRIVSEIRDIYGANINEIFIFKNRKFYEIANEIKKYISDDFIKYKKVISSENNKKTKGIII